MYKALIFGGTTEGRALYYFARESGIAALTCVATEYGAALLGTDVHTGRLDYAGMVGLMRDHVPALVVDATHPYALDVSRNARDACRDTGTEYLRVSRRFDGGGERVDSLEGIIDRIRTSDGIVFSTLGANEADAFTTLPDYRDRVWLRILPYIDSLSHCLTLGFAPSRIICMQGPFSKSLNAAMLRETGASILVTKDSGKTGGFYEKLEAANELGVRVLVLGRPADCGVTLEDAIRRLAAL